MNDTVDEFPLASYFETFSKDEKISSCFEDYLDKHYFSLKNITAIATDGAPARVGCKSMLIVI